MSRTSAVEDLISFRGYRVWYRIVKPDEEKPGKLPLLCLHGGLGVPHDYLEPLEAIAATGRSVKSVQSFKALAKSSIGILKTA